MNKRKAFSVDPHNFIDELKKITSHPFSPETADLLDEADPLSYTAEMFDVGALIPLAGHSLGPGLKKTAENIDRTLKLQRRLHEGHFPDTHPEGKDSGHWFDCDRHAPSLNGAKQLLNFNSDDEFCFMGSSLSQNFAMVLQTFFRPEEKDWKTERTKLLMLDTEFFSDRAVAASIMKREIKRVESTFHLNVKPTPESEILTVKPNKDGIYTTDSIIEAIKCNAEKLQVICLSDIVFSTGQRLDLPKIFSETRTLIEKYKIRVILDLAHTIGNRPIDLASMPVTAAVGCAYKHLSGPAGSAFGVYVNAAADLNAYPPIRGWKSADSSKVFGKINQYTPDIMVESKGAVAFRMGNPPPISLAPAQAFLTEFGRIGFDKLFKKSEQLTSYLIAQLQHHLGDKIEFITPLDPNQRGATICVRIKGQVDTHQIEEKLKRAGYEIDTRPPNIIRITAHYGYTKFSHVQSFVQQFKKILCPKQQPVNYWKLGVFAAAAVTGIGLVAKALTGAETPRPR